MVSACVKVPVLEQGQQPVKKCGYSVCGAGNRAQRFELSKHAFYHLTTCPGQAQTFPESVIASWASQTLNKNFTKLPSWANALDNMSVNILTVY